MEKPLDPNTPSMWTTPPVQSEKERQAQAILERLDRELPEQYRAKVKRAMRDILNIYK